MATTKSQPDDVNNDLTVLKTFLGFKFDSNLNPTKKLSGLTALMFSISFGVATKFNVKALPDAILLLQAFASLKSETKQNYGVIDRASLVFERHGIFVHKGVGRGYKMSGGVVIRTAKSVSPAVTRRPVEWFNPIITLMIPELVKDLEQVNADAVINATRLVIK